MVHAATAKHCQGVSTNVGTHGVGKPSSPHGGGRANSDFPACTMVESGGESEEQCFHKSTNWQRFSDNFLLANYQSFAQM